MNFDELKFTPKELVKAAGAALFLGSMWYDLKVEQLKQQNKIEMIEYKVSELKACKQVAILPKKIEIETQ